MLLEGLEKSNTGTYQLTVSDSFILGRDELINFISRISKTSKIKLNDNVNEKYKIEYNYFKDFKTKKIGVIFSKNKYSGDLNVKVYRISDNKLILDYNITLGKNFKYSSTFLIKINYQGLKTIDFNAKKGYNKKFYFPDKIIDKINSEYRNGVNIKYDHDFIINNLITDTGNREFEDKFLDLIKSNPEEYLNVKFISTIKFNNITERFISKFYNLFSNEDKNLFENVFVYFITIFMKYNNNKEKFLYILNLIKNHINKNHKNISLLTKIYLSINISNDIFTFHWYIKKYAYKDKDIMKIYNDIMLKGYKTRSSFIYYISKASKELQLDAIKKDSRNLQYIINNLFKDNEQYEEIYMKSVMKEPFCIYYIPNPSEKLQLADVKQKGSCILYVNNPTENVQYEAVKQNINNIFFISNPDLGVVFYCIKCEPELLKIKGKIHSHQKISYNYFQDLSLEVQKMLVEYKIMFTLLIPNLHPSLKTELTNIRDIGLF